MGAAVHAETPMQNARPELLKTAVQLDRLENDQVAEVIQALRLLRKRIRSKDKCKEIDKLISHGMWEDLSLSRTARTEVDCPRRVCDTGVGKFMQHETPNTPQIGLTGTSTEVR
jgi:hypothetical protein